MSKFPDPESLRKVADGIEASNKASQEALEKGEAAKVAQAKADTKSAEASKALAKVVPAAGGRGGNGNPRKPLVLGADGSDDGVRKAILLGIAALVLIALVAWLAILTGTKANNSEVSAVKQTADTAQATANEAKADAKNAKENANKAISEASEAKADAASAISTAKEAKTLAEKCNCKRDCIKAEPAASSPKPKPKAKTPTKPKATTPPKAKCTDCVPREVPRKLSETPRRDGRCFVQAQSGSYKYKFELRHETRTGRLMITLVDSNDEVRPGARVIYLGNEMSVVNAKGVDCDGNQDKLYANWSFAKEAFQLPSACELIARKP